jgi:hypothetical protein
MQACTRKNTPTHLQRPRRVLRLLHRQLILPRLIVGRIIVVAVIIRIVARRGGSGGRLVLVLSEQMQG